MFRGGLTNSFEGGLLNDSLNYLFLLFQVHKERDQEAEGWRRGVHRL